MMTQDPLMKHFDLPTGAQAVPDMYQKNMFTAEKDYQNHASEDEIFKCIVDHLSQGVEFHDKMTDLYGFLGLLGFKKIHEYQYYAESIERRNTKCYVLEHLNLLLEETKNTEKLSFIPQSWYGHNRHEVSAEAKKQYIEPSFHGYKQWEEETKHLLSHCANELLTMDKISDFKTVSVMIQDVEQELNCLENLMLKLKAMNYDMEYILNLQNELYCEYEHKLMTCFEEKLASDKKLYW